MAELEPRKPRPTCAGNYILGDALAEGGFGVVYRAEHATERTPAAVKILHAELATNAEAMGRFEREIEAVRRVRHPNVLEILEHGRVEDGRPYFAMELLAGASLEQHLRERGRLPAGDALAILEPICSALTAAHAQAIVHRDIKPSNVFLSERDGALRVVLLDFGVAKLLDATGPGLTTSRNVVGTPAFIAPEQLAGLPVDARADVYALGGLTYRMLTGDASIGYGGHPMLKHFARSAPRPSARARVSPAVDALVARCMSRDPAVRPATVADFLEEVRAALEQDRDTPVPSAPAAHRALGVHVDVLADAAALDVLDGDFLDHFEMVLPLALDTLSSLGFAPAVETHTSLLLVAPRPDDEACDRTARRRVLDAARALHHRLMAHPARDPRVRVRFCLHTGVVETTRDGAMTGGDLLELGAWVPDAAEEGVLASPALLADLDLEARPDPAAGALLRVV